MGEKYNRRTIMKRLFVVVEGQTEQEFVREVLSPYLYSYGIYDVRPIPIRTSKTGRGGFVNYYHLKNTVEPLLKSEGNDVVVTTFVDFFRIPNNTPHYSQCMRAARNVEKVSEIERCIAADINDRKFLPYIQLHEFEALLFSNNKGFEEYFTEEQSAQTDVIVREFDNPEDINTRPQYAPSKRILGIKKEYNKPIEGNLIAIAVGINIMLERCPRFAAWVADVIDRCQS